ncbi:Uncharacterised protein [Staphylococcus aureus]|nr:Uncharacterised protein [Staphylococcus aureus]
MSGINCKSKRSASVGTLNKCAVPVLATFTVANSVFFLASLITKFVAPCLLFVCIVVKLIINSESGFTLTVFEIPLKLP